MANYAVKEINSKEEWEDIVLSYKPQSFLQSWNWGETNRLVGSKILRLGFVKSGKLVGACLLVEQKAKRGLHMLIPGGPLIDWEDEELTKFVLNTLRETAKQYDAWFVRIRPEIIDSPESRKMFAKLGLIPAPMHLHAENTWVLGLTSTEEEILANMRKTTRYLIRQSLKQGLKFEESQNPDDAHILKKLQDETVARHKFVGFSEKLFRAQIETFGKDKQASLFMCKKGEEVLAAAIIIFYGDIAYYHHSGSTLTHPKIPASYFLQWEVIKEAKRRGCKLYNFWGIAPTDDPKHRFSGVTLFKKGFGGARIDWLHAHDLSTSPLYRATYIFETARRIIRRL
ncbi:MAG: peptidoglycan bridge formation glycyltransferase FemA/FemB family protein [bacterium]|nr:peptidoglycan bridge formation glycyltransferase FemA/FemB family protein [bacterium]